MSTVHGEQVRVLEEHGTEGPRGLNWWGMIFFIASEALIFANLIAGYLYLEIRNLGQGIHWTLPSGEQLPILYPTGLNTIILLSSSAWMIWGARGLRKGNMRQLAWGLALTIIFGTVFLILQGVEYFSLFGENFTIGYKTFGSSFFTLTGFHGLHVFIGALFLLICLIRTLRGDFTPQKHFAVQAAEMYWHFVDIVWIFVFSIVYLLPLALPR